MSGVTSDSGRGDAPRGSIVKLPSPRPTEDDASGRRPRRTDVQFQIFPVLLLLVGASGIAAGLSEGQPSPIGAVSLALKVALGAAVALAGSVVPPSWIVVSSAILTAATAGRPEMVPAAIALGVSLADVWSERGARFAGRTRPYVGVMRTALAAALCQLALRLSWPPHALLPSLVAAAALLTVLIPAVVVAEARKKILWLAGPLALVAVALTALAAFSALQAKASLDHGLRSIHLGLHALETGDEATAASDFATAHESFTSASAALSKAQVAELVPVVAQQVRVARLAAALGAQVSGAASRTSASAAREKLSISGGVFHVAALETLQPLLARDLTTLDNALSESRAFTSPWLIAPLKVRLEAETSKLKGAARDDRTALAALRVLPQLVGMNAEQKYLVLFEDPAESRASGGVIGDYGQLTAAKGEIRLTALGSVGQLNSAGDPATKHLVGPESYIERYSQFEPELYWENVPMSPDFPSVGEVASNLYPQSGGDRVGGVISLDPVAMADFLRVTGPISVPGWPVPITSANATAILAHQEFVAFGANGNSLRISFVQDLIKALWHRLLTRQLPSLPTLARDLKPALRGGHLMLYSENASAEQFFKTVDVAGAMPPVRGDFLGVVTQNAAGNKLDWYLRRYITYHATVNLRERQIGATVTVRLRNLAPSSGLPPIVLDPAPGVTTAPGEDELFVSIYSPWEEDGATLNGVPFVVTSQQELGRLVYSALITVPPGGTTTIRLRLLGEWTHGRHYQLGLYHQPVLFADHLKKSVRFAS